MIKKEIHTRRILKMPKIVFTDIVPITEKEKTKGNENFLKNSSIGNATISKLLKVSR